jgi:hypothetical protein
LRACADHSRADIGAVDDVDVVAVSLDTCCVTNSVDADVARRRQGRCLLILGGTVLSVDTEVVPDSEDPGAGRVWREAGRLDVVEDVDRLRRAGCGGAPAYGGACHADGGAAGVTFPEDADDVVAFALILRDEARVIVGDILDLRSVRVIGGMAGVGDVVVLAYGRRRNLAPAKSLRAGGGSTAQTG